MKDEKLGRKYESINYYLFEYVAVCVASTSTFVTLFYTCLDIAVCAREEDTKKRLWHFRSGNGNY